MMLKMYTFNGKWAVLDKDRPIIFDTSYDAWCFVFLMKAIRTKAPTVPRSLYPVKTLDPREEGRKKNVRLHT